ncbi:MAG: hypothetical protein Q8P95_00735 [bacterium]|nr:hypothetical protein [bacterium]
MSGPAEGTPDIEAAIALPEAAKAAGPVADPQAGIDALSAKSTIDAVLADTSSETAEVSLARFQAQFESPKFQNKGSCTWQEVEKRLTANNGHYLNLAVAMEQGGTLFGIDKDGNPLIADGGVEPILCGMNYANTRRAVMFTEGEEGSEPTPTGYELFPYAGDYEKSPEILAFEAATGEPFIRSEDSEQYRESWLESGDDPAWPGRVGFFPADGDARVFGGRPQLSNPRLGARRLLRVKA